MRCFLAIDLSDEARNAAARWMHAQKRDLRDIRWNDVAQLHITLHFLGEIDAAQRDGLRSALQTIAASIMPFRLHLGEIGAFPSPSAPRVIWIGVDDPAECCAAIFCRTMPAIAAAGIRIDDRPFTPHVTLGRAHGSAGVRNLARWFAETTPLRRGRPSGAAARTDKSGGTVVGPNPAPIEFPVCEMVLYESHLTPTGALHTPLDRFHFSRFS